MSVKNEPWALIPRSNLDLIEKQVDNIHQITTNTEIISALDDIDASLEMNVYNSQVVPKQVV